MNDMNVKINEASKGIDSKIMQFNPADHGIVSKLMLDETLAEYRDWLNDRMRKIIGRVDAVERDFAEVSCIARTELAHLPGMLDNASGLEAKQITLKSSLSSNYKQAIPTVK